MYICEISIIVILICEKLGLVGPVQQKFKLPCLKEHWNFFPGECFLVSFDLNCFNSRFNRYLSHKGSFDICLCFSASFFITSFLLVAV